MNAMREMLLGGLALAIGAGGAAAQSGAPAPAQTMISVQMPAPPAPVAVSLKPATTALVVSDVVEPICQAQPKCAQGMVPKIADLLARARKAGVLVAYTTQEAAMSKWMPAVAPASGDPLVISHGQDRFYSTELDNVLKAKGITTVVLTGWKVSGSLLYTSVGATLRGYTVVVPADTTNAPNDYEVPIGIYAMLNQNSANATNEPLKPKTTTISRSDLIKFD
ncbi:MAG TPA: isochorismatase family protein [Stellaceae bacterium]|nr:isochorismatase family protein [Stellaceae bacterium]